MPKQAEPDKDDDAAKRLIREVTRGHEDDQAAARGLVLAGAKVVPGIGHLMRSGEALLQGLRTRRKLKLREFVRTFDWCVDTSDIAGAAEKVREAVDSEIGEELIDDYAKKILDTFSPTARVALAVLLADELINKYDPAFHRLAARAFVGLTEAEIDLFLEFDGIKQAGVLHDEVCLSVGNIHELSERVGLSEGVGFGVVDGLMNRGLMPRGNLKDRFSQADDFYTILLWGPTSSRYADLLREAKRIRAKINAE